MPSVARAEKSSVLTQSTRTTKPAQQTTAIVRHGIRRFLRFSDDALTAGVCGFLLRNHAFFDNNSFRVQKEGVKAAFWWDFD